MRLPAASLLLFCSFGLVTGRAQAQVNRSQMLAMVTPAATYTPASRPAAVRRLAAQPVAAVIAAPAAVALRGQVETPAGMLPGAVVSVTDNPAVRAITNSAGEFMLTVPASNGPVSLTASYAGYQDVTLLLMPGDTRPVLHLVVPHDIEVSRQMQLKRYLKTARREVRHDLREMRRD